MINVNQILNDPACSYWLKYALESALKRDPVDALEDVLIMKEVLEERLNEVIKRNSKNPVK